jgi:Rod binding domain-containing protein
MIDLANNVDVSTLNQKKFDNVNTKNLEDDKLRDVCDNFEAFFLKQIMDTSLKTTNIAGEGTGSDIIKSMYTDAVSNSAAGGMGISNLLYEFLSKK